MSQQQHRSAQRRAEKRHRREVERRRARTAARKEDPVAPDLLRRLAGDDLVPSVDEETVVHPYLSHRYREREFLVRGTPWRWRREMPGFWTHAEVAALDDDALFTALAERGLVVSRADVLAHIARMPAGGSAWRMSRIHWLPAIRSRSLSAPDRDFLGLAAVESWRRLRPDDPPLESLLAILADADDLQDDDKAGQLAGMIRFLAAVRARGGPDEAGEVSGVRLSLGGPYTRMVILAFKLVGRHPQLAADALAEAEHWAERSFPDDEFVGDGVFLRRMLVLVCVELGRDDHAERLLRVALAKDPDDPATRRLLAVQLHEDSRQDRSRLVEALELWDSARRSGDDDDDEFFQRTRDEIAESLRALDVALAGAAE